jgi:16S rRNA (cytosine967-C5)-methyltransferase
MIRESLDGPRARANAVWSLQQITEHRRTLDWLITNKASWLDTPFGSQLIYGTVRHYYSLETIIEQLLKKPLKSKDRDLFHLLVVGAYQLLHMKLPAYASINETVSACSLLRKNWAKGFINAVLRKVDRRKKEVGYSDLWKQNHPAWFVNKLKKQYPQRWQAICAANDQQPAMAIRVNALRTSVELYRKKLGQENIQFSEGKTEQGLILQEPIPSRTLPGWLRGEVSVQDLGAQYAAPLLMNALSTNTNNPTILDACAAPGGKLSHLNEILANKLKDYRLIAIEKSRERLEMTRKLVKRSQQEEIEKIIFIEADSTEPLKQINFECDAIMLDAPCSGSGTVRRNPDIRILFDPLELELKSKFQIQFL